MAILNLLRWGALADRAMRQGEWPYPRMRGRELGALTVGVLGLGNVGNAVAARVRAFGSRVIFTDVVPRSLAGAAQGPLDELPARGGVATGHRPPDPGPPHPVRDAQLPRLP